MKEEVNKINKVDNKPKIRLRSGLKKLSSGTRKGVSVDKLVSLKNAGMAERDIADRLGTNEYQVSQAIKENQEYMEFCTDKRQAYNRIMFDIYKELNIETIQALTPYQKVLSLGILHDKLIGYKDTSGMGVETSIRLAIIELDKRK